LPGSPLRGQDQAKAAEIEAWLEQVAETYNILSMDARTFRSWARLVHRKPDRLVEDAMIAATATVHGLTVVTRNVRDFMWPAVGKPCSSNCFGASAAPASR
jgi:toxin FitB